MANPTTNYGWPMPTATDLVTDLPADFALFGQPVDTSLKALNPETTLGDIAYRSSTSNTNTRLGIGTNGQVLAVSSGVPAWTTTADVTPLTTKGDVFTFSTVDARIGVGANNTVLTADSAEATGLKWATPAGAMTLISTTTLGATASTINFSTISSAYQHLRIVYSSTGANDFIRMYFNNVTTSTYYSQYNMASNTTISGAESLAANSMRCGLKEAIFSGVIDIPDYKNTTIKKTMLATTGYRQNASTGATRTIAFFGTNDATTAISQIDITSDSVFGIGSVFSLYGVS